jgi:hypothetical protein
MEELSGQPRDAATKPQRRTRRIEAAVDAVVDDALVESAQEVVVSRGVARDPQLELAPPGLICQPMVRWYDPRNLLRSAYESFVSTVIGKYADQRRVVGQRSDRPKFFDYRGHDGRDADGGFWIDYVADAGDGWDSTFTVARGVGMSTLEVGGAGERGEEMASLPRASILIFGGDEVYPVGSQRGYDERLVAPYAAAVRDLADAAPHPDVFAVPGNHDWYDSLVAFSRKFLSGRWFAHWRTLQNRSYFALRLPGGWWLLGTDVQLGSDLDGEQLEYFEHLAAHHMAEGDRVILCNAEPHWVREALRGGDDAYHLANLRDLEARVLKDRTWLYLAGDLHHYRRHACAAEGRHKITAGGGGAFTHPTHTNRAKLARLPERAAGGSGGRAPARSYDLVEESCFPPPAQSRRITLRNALPLSVLWRQPRFFLVPAILYLLTCWIVPLQLVYEGGSFRGFGSLLGRVWSHLMLENRGAALWTVLVVVGFVMLTQLRRTWCRWLSGLLHAFAHMLAVLLCTWLAVRLTSGLSFSATSWGYLLRGGIIFLTGGLLGSTVFGWYLMIMCEGFGAHENEAAATQGFQHWKSFLRLHVAANGELTVHPIGIARTPRWWPRGYSKGGEEPAADDGRKDAEIYRYIEPPIVIRAGRAGR